MAERGVYSVQSANALFWTTKCSDMVKHKTSTKSLQEELTSHIYNLSRWQTSKTLKYHNPNISQYCSLDRILNGSNPKNTPPLCSPTFEESGDFFCFVFSYSPQLLSDTGRAKALFHRHAALAGEVKALVAVRKTGSKEVEICRNEAKKAIREWCDRPLEKMYKQRNRTWFWSREHRTDPSDPKDLKHFDLWYQCYRGSIMISYNGDGRQKKDIFQSTKWRSASFSFLLRFYWSPRCASAGSRWLSWSSRDNKRWQPTSVWKPRSTWAVYTWRASKHNSWSSFPRRLRNALQAE